LKDFVSSPTCALLKMDVETYYVVRQFQKVEELRIRKDIRKKGGARCKE